MNKVILDAGHGAINPSTGLYTTAPNKMFRHANGKIAYEGVYNRIIASIIEKKAIDKGYEVVRTYHDFIDTTLRNRAALANQHRGVFISIHHNASPKNNGRGFEVWTSRGKNRSDILATDIFNECFKLLNGYMRFRSDNKDGDPDFEADFTVLKLSRNPAVLVECAFFDNVLDFKLMNDPIWQDNICEGILNGIIKFYER
jgi:N-acetylmuramoyl-L-alanine amidase